LKGLQRSFEHRRDRDGKRDHCSDQKILCHGRHGQRHDRQDSHQSQGDNQVEATEVIQSAGNCGIFCNSHCFQNLPTLSLVLGDMNCNRYANAGIWGPPDGEEGGFSRSRGSAENAREPVNKGLRRCRRTAGIETNIMPTVSRSGPSEGFAEAGWRAFVTVILTLAPKFRHFFACGRDFPLSFVRTALQSRPIGEP
jgi:hypothetical protein